MSSLGISSCFHAEPNALPGFLESAVQWADEIVMISAPPPGVEHCEESLEIIKKWGGKIVLSSVEEGFGVLRTQCIRESSCEFVAILDADERFPVLRRVMSCAGSEKYPENSNPNLTVTQGAVFDQGKALRSLLDSLEPSQDAVVMPRYHWMDFSHKRPSQNFCDNKDFQCRLVRNAEHIGYKSERKLHEHLVDFRSGNEPNMFRQNPHEREIAIFHYHAFFKALSPEKNKLDMKTYKALDEGLTQGMWLEQAEGVR